MNLAGLRARVRASREVPVLGSLVRAADRIWWWRIIRRSGLVDAGFYAAQLGVSRIASDAAIWHYVARGFRRGLSLNPLFDETFAGGGLPEVFRVPALYAYLVGERATIPVHPWWDAVAATGADGAPALERVWNDHSLELTLRAGRGETRMTVTALRELAISAARSWSAVGRSGHAGRGSAASGSEASVGLVRFIQAHDRRYHRKLDQAARLVQAGSAAVSVAMVGVDAAQWVSASVLAAIEPGVSVRLHGAGRTWGSVLADEVVAFGTQRLLAVLDARAEFAPSEIEALWAEAETSCAIPAHRAPDGTLAGLGAARVGTGQAYRILSGHPHEDAGAIADRALEVPLATGRTFAVDLSAYRAAGGIRAEGGRELEALSARLSAHGIPSRVLLDVLPVLEEPEFAFGSRRRVPSGETRPSEADRHRAEQIMVDAGFDVHGWRFRGLDAPVPVLSWRRPSPEARRWAIKICAPAGRQGAVWGDTHFAVGLANALRRRGQTVVIDAYDARDRDTGYLDDVSVAIRGPYRLEAPRWGVRIQWIISHPDEVTRAEAAGYDRVFAASFGWATRTSERWGLRIDTLLEATDTDQFQPVGLERGTDIVFVGTARGIPRPSVVAPVAAGIPVRVYGPDWRPFIPQSAIAATSIPNADLPARYETASIVLNDQWPAMQREGFIAMRPFDAVAVGGRVVSETVEGIEEIFDGAVVAYRDAAHLVELLRTDPADLFPTRERMAEIAARIRSEHSFDARAALLAEVADGAAAGAERAQR